jgi:hypothetical protein
MSSGDLRGATRMSAFTGNGRGIALPGGFTLGTAIIRILCRHTTAKRVVTLILNSFIHICHNSILLKYMRIASTIFIVIGRLAAVNARLRRKYCDSIKFAKLLSQKSKPNGYALRLSFCNTAVEDL